MYGRGFFMTSQTLTATRKMAARLAALSRLFNVDFYPTAPAPVTKSERVYWKYWNTVRLYFCPSVRVPEFVQKMFLEPLNLL